MAKATKGAPQNGDTPFTFKSKTGATITIPAGTSFDPDADALVALQEAIAAEDELTAVAATVRMIKSGFPESVARKINLKASELQEFTTAYQQHTGVNIPKS